MTPKNIQNTFIFFILDINQHSDNNTSNTITTTSTITTTTTTTTTTSLNPNTTNSDSSHIHSKANSNDNLQNTSGLRNSTNTINLTPIGDRSSSKHVQQQQQQFGDGLALASSTTALSTFDTQNVGNLGKS